MKLFIPLKLLTLLLAFIPPSLEIPAEVRPDGQYVAMRPETNAVSVSYVGLSGAEAINSDYLADRTQFLLCARGLAAGRYRFAAIGASSDGEQTRQDFTVVIGDAPEPVPPDPVPPDPTPEPDPAPEPLADLRVIFVYESTDGLTREQDNVMHSRKVSDYLKAKQVPFRRWDRDTNVDNEPDPKMRSTMTAARGKLGQLPQVIVAGGGKIRILPWPATEAAMLQLLRTYGGE